MVELLSTFFAGIVDFLDFLYGWFTRDIYDIAKDILVYWTKFFIKAGLAFFLLALDVAYTVALEFMAELNITSSIESAFNGLDSTTYQLAAFFKIPHLIQTVIAAFGTRFSLKFVPFYG